MKTAIWILSLSVIGLAILAFMQYRTIQKLKNPERISTRVGDGDVRFGDMVSAFQKEAREITIITKL